MKMSMATKVAAVVGTVVVAAGGLATAALADSGGSAAPAVTQAAAATEQGPGRVMLARRAVHGEVVARTADGYRTFSGQRGTVTAVTASSLTVRGDRQQELPLPLLAGHQRGGEPVDGLTHLGDLGWPVRREPDIACRVPWSSV